MLSNSVGIAGLEWLNEPDRQPAPAVNRWNQTPVLLLFWQFHTALLHSDMFLVCFLPVTASYGRKKSDYIFWRAEICEDLFGDWYTCWEIRIPICRHYPPFHLSALLHRFTLQTSHRQIDIFAQGFAKCHTIDCHNKSHTFNVFVLQTKEHWYNTLNLAMCAIAI